MKIFLLRLLKLVILISFSLSIFYFFETPFLIETAWAEEGISESTLSRDKVEVTSETQEKEDSTEKEKIKKEEQSWYNKVTNFLWNYKWYFIITGVVIVSSIFLYYNFTKGSAKDNIAPEVMLSIEGAKALLEDPKFPDWTIYAENFKGFAFSIEAAKVLPEHFMVKKACFSDATGSQLTGILFESANGQSIIPFRVYPTKPILLADPNLSLLVNQAEILLEQARTFSGVLVDNPFGYSNDPSMNVWITHAKEVYPVLKDMDPNSFVFQYQKVALVDPLTFKFAYFHQVSVVPLNAEALATPYEVNLTERLLRVYLFKDNEAAWMH